MISKREFRTLLDALSFFQAQWLKFESIDRDGDLSMDIAEFVNDRSTLGLGDLSVRQAEDVVSVELRVRFCWKFLFTTSFCI